MVRLVTKYDKDISSKVFEVRGDEAYARTTDTLFELFELSNSYDKCTGYRLGMHINVLRDKGDSSVIIYDGDEPITSIDWLESSDERNIGSASDDNGLFLSYDTQHKIWAKYLGNSKCLSSRSDIIESNVEFPSKFNLHIYQGVDRFNDYSSKGNVNIPFMLRDANNKIADDDGNIYNTIVNQDIDIYVDDIHKVNTSNTIAPYTQVTTDSKGAVQWNPRKLGDGAYKITARWYNLQCNISDQKSCIFTKGIKIEWYQHPFFFNKEGGDEIIARVTSYLDEPFSNYKVNLGNVMSTINTDGIEGAITIHEVDSGTTDENGFVTLHTTRDMYNFSNKIVLIGDDQYGGQSSIINAIYIPDVTIELTPKSSIMGYNERNYVDVVVRSTETNESIPDTNITVTHIVMDYDHNEEILLTTTMKTDSKGSLVVPVIGQGYGAYKIKVNCGDDENTVVIEDYLTYIGQGKSINTNILSGSTFTQRGNNYSFDNGVGSFAINLAKYMQIDEDTKIRINVEGVSANTGYYAGVSSIDNSNHYRETGHKFSNTASRLDIIYEDKTLSFDAYDNARNPVNHTVTSTDSNPLLSNSKVPFWGVSYRQSTTYGMWKIFAVMRYL